MVNIAAFVCVITLSIFVVVSADYGNETSVDNLEEDEFSIIMNNTEVDNDEIDSINDTEPTVTQTNSTDDRLLPSKTPKGAKNEKRKGKGRKSKNKSALNMISTTKMPKRARGMSEVDEENDYVDLRGDGNSSREDSLYSDAKSKPANEENKATCASPPEIEGAIIPRVEGTEHALGKSVTYSCNFGYVSRNTINHISTCVFNENTGKAEWTVPEMACIPQSCGDPGTVNNGRRIGSLFTFPNKVDYECDEGYKLRGLRSRYCQVRGEWSGRLPSCEIIYCAAPPDPINGRAIYSSLEYGSVLSYECDIGLFLSNDQPRFCTADGSWSGDEPECTGEVRCKEPTAPDHGTVNLSGEPKVGSIARYSCDPGKMLLGASNVKCLITGQWTFDTPKCLSFCFVPYIDNGEMGHMETEVSGRRSNRVFNKFSAGEQVKHNEVLTMRCKNGFSPEEESTSFNNNEVEVKCNDGTWSKVLQCRQTLSNCPGNPPTIKNGFPVIDSREHGFTIWYKCRNKHDHKVEGNVTCHFGSWIGIPPKCLRNPCKTADLNYPGLLKPLDDLMASAESFDIKCDEGFRKSSSVKKITCDRGKWNIAQNPCSEDRDQDVRVLTPQPLTLVEIQQKQIMKPDTSTLSRPEECFCVIDYSNNNNLRVRSGGKVLKMNDKVRQGETISFECGALDKYLTWPNGLRLYGEANMTCNTCKKWQRNEHPDCKRLAGEPVIEYEGNLTVLTNGYLVGIKRRNIKLTCMTDRWQPFWYFGGKRLRTQKHNSRRNFPREGITVHYSRIDIISATQEDSGRYECRISESTSLRSNLNLEIRELSCRLFSTGNGLSVSYDTGNKVGSLATFDCSSNAKLVGEKYSVCQRDGTWSVPQPYCEETCIRCPVIDGKGIFTFKYENDRKINSTALIFCKDFGKRVEGSNRLTCLSNRTWSVSDAACVDYSDCTRFPPAPDIEVVYSRGISVGSNASFICHLPKVLVGIPYAICQDDGTWSNSPPTCEEPKCSIGVLAETVAEFDAVPVMTGVNEEYMSLDFEVDLKCEDSLVISGNSKAKCGSLGKWELGRFECVPGCILELDPSSDITVEPLKPGYQLGDFIHLSCPQGKEMTDNVKRMACLGSKWSHSVPSCIESEYGDSSGL